MSYQDTDDNTLRAAIADADPLTKAWGLELLRVCTLTKRESWEEVLLDLTEQLEPTMKKIAQQCAAIGKRHCLHPRRFTLLALRL